MTAAMSRSFRPVAIIAAFAFVLARPAVVEAQTVSSTPAAQGPLPAPPAPGSRVWIVAGAGFSLARAGCATCDRAGVLNRSRSLLLDAGVRINPKVDAGIELHWVSSRVESEAPVRTTFILALAQLRPWHQRGFFMRVGMGIGFAGNGLYNPIENTLAPPYTTNALGLTYGAGWVFSPYHRIAFQTHATHHVAALGELTSTTGTVVKNVVGNYWTIGTAVVIR